MVAPCLPIRSPRSSPLTVARISSELSSMSTVARNPSACTTRATMARTRSAGSCGISSACCRQVSTSTSARTRAGRPSEGSSTTSKLTHSAFSPGKRGSSVFMAAHLASPRLSPSASATSSSGRGSSLTDITRILSAPATGALLLLARRRRRRLRARAARAAGSPMPRPLRPAWRRPCRPSPSLPSLPSFASLPLPPSEAAMTVLGGLPRAGVDAAFPPRLRRRSRASGRAS